MTVTSHFKRPTRTQCGITLEQLAVLSLSGLAPNGVYHARSVTRPAVLLPHSPLLVTPGGIFSVALSLGSPPPGVTRHPDPVEPGLSSVIPLNNSSRHPAIRQLEIIELPAYLGQATRFYFDFKSLKQILGFIKLDLHFIRLFG